MSHPYSRSHLRREKRKAAGASLGGGLGSVALALAEAAGDEEAPVKEEVVGKKMSKKEVLEDAARRREEERKRKLEEGKIGEGAGHGLKEKARRKQM